MPHNTPAICDSPTLTGFSDEQFNAVVELADAIRELTDQFGQVQQTLDVYESRLLQTEPEMRQLHPQPDANNLKQWQKFIERVNHELDTLTPPV